MATRRAIYTLLKRSCYSQRSKISWATRESNVLSSRVYPPISRTWSRHAASYRRAYCSSASAENEHNHSNQTNSLTLSESCVQQLHKVARGEPVMLRVTVEGGGCSGFQYKFSLDSNMGDDDRVFEREGAKVVTDALSLEFLAGSTVDYRREMIRSSFVISDNPNTDQGCSCGISFTLK